MAARDNTTTIRITYEVAEAIKEYAKPFDSVDAILRRIFSLPPTDVKRGRPKKKKESVK